MHSCPTIADDQKGGQSAGEEEHGTKDGNSERYK
jgi:hypothetical protein